MTTQDVIFDPMRKMMAKSALKYAVGHAIFCPGCERVMDCSRAVTVDVRKGEKLEGTRTMCAACWDGRVKANMEAMLKEPKFAGLTLEVTDGRVLFAKVRKPKVKAPQVVEDIGLTVAQVLEREGVDPDDCEEYLESLVVGDQDCPSLCAQGCVVETDGKCVHGHVSLLRAMGVI